VAALCRRPKSKAMGEAQMGSGALMSQALRKLTGAVSKSKTCLIFINQLREKIGVMFSNPETTTGSRALKFYAWWHGHPPHRQHQGRRRRGRRPDRVKVVKKRSLPLPRGASSTSYGEGISKSGDLLDLAVASGLSKERRLVRVRRTARPGSRERGSSSQDNPRSTRRSTTASAGNSG
jgi:recombination protein RecA